MIFIRKTNGWFYISDNIGNHMTYIFYTKREALRKFKEKFGYRYKHGIEIVEE